MKFFSHSPPFLCFLCWPFVFWAGAAARPKLIFGPNDESGKYAKHLKNEFNVLCFIRIKRFCYIYRVSPAPTAHNSPSPPLCAEFAPRAIKVQIVEPTIIIPKRNAKITRGGTYEVMIRLTDTLQRRETCLHIKN